MDTVDQQILALLTESADVILRYALDVVAAVLLLIGGWVIAGWARRTIVRHTRRSSRLDETVGLVLGSAARYGVLIMVLVAVLAQFGVQTASIIAALGAAGLAIGLALQGTLSNLAAGIMLLVVRPFHVGEYIDAGGVDGTVQEIGLLTTELEAADGVYRMVPNSTLWTSTITNYSRNATRRLDVAVGVSYDDDIDKGFEVLHDLAAGDARVLADPEPQVMVTELGDNAVVLNLRVWTNTGDFWSLKWDFTREAKARLEEAGLSIPFPQRDMHIYRHDIGEAAGV